MEFKLETKKNKVVFIAGLTASGKSDLAIWLARRIGGEIINADSRQIYLGLDFGSAKISKTEEKKVKHYLLSFASPRQNYSLGRWLEDADQAVKKIIRAGRMPIFCGGTLLYLKSLVEGWRLVKVKPNRKLRKDLEKKTLADLLSALKKIDPVRLKTVDQNNKRRIIRAIEIGRQLGSD
ncbi:tRNA (adenosine(37)-N6)-dimethylallyltransferase MiaA, partial [Patescibacteria group bacterium]|nr:tRNA (adenosine(37)-N6)-dimethylallyltransferase MiaA [Patescibacteria group bacterium]